MTYLVVQMLGALLVAAAFGASLLWLSQVFWGRFRAPVRSKAMEFEVEELKVDRKVQDNRIATLESELSLANEQIERLQQTKRQLTASLDARNHAMQDVEFQLATAERGAGTVEAVNIAEALRGELREAVKERDQIATDMRETAARHDRLRTEIEVLHGIHERMLDDIEGLKGRLRDAQLQTQTTTDSRPPAWVMVQPFGPRDDLQRLEGVDPKLEQTLNRLGVYHFHQIARFESSDVQWIAEHVDGVPETVIRDSWIVEAARLSGRQGN